MNSVGIDLHRRRSQVAALDERGRKLLSRRIDNDPQTFLELLAEIDGESKIALEATYGWEWLADVLEQAGYELHLAHPLRTKAIASARVKTDSVDAATLAHLLRTDLLPEAYIAPRELRDLRDLLRHRVALTHMRSALKNRVHALLARQGVRHEHTDLFGKAGLEFLAALELREPPRRRLASLLALIADFDREIAATSDEIDQRAKHDERVDVLCQIRGVGRYTAMLVIAEIGAIGPLRQRAQAVRLGRADPDRQKLRRQGPARPHHPPALQAAALGARRGRPTRRPRRRPTARRLRADKQAPRPQDRQGRGRPQDPHALLLRTARRRDPLPGAPRPAERDSSHGGLVMRPADVLIAPPAPRATRTLGRARYLSWPPDTEDGRPLD
jgi:transposase